MPKLPRPPVIIYWFKYGLTLFVVTKTSISSIDGIITPDELQNGSIVAGIWVSTPKKKKEDDPKKDE